MAAASGSEPSLRPSGNSVGAGEKGSNFFLGFVFLPADRREALSAVYAYCRLIDDIVDEGLPKDEAATQLSFWREEIERLYAGTPTHAISKRLVPVVKAFGLPKEAFLEMIRGCEMDLRAHRYDTFADLESYMQGVACSVGRLSVKIFGYDHTPEKDILEFAKLFGYAFQLTNIIRDVGADLELGRVYLPEEELRKHGYSRERLMRREPAPEFDALMRSLHARAKLYYRQARSFVDFRDRPRLLPAEIMAHVYEGVLDEIATRDFPVLFEKTTLSKWRKLGRAFAAWRYCHGF